MKTWKYENLKKLAERYEPSGQGTDIVTEVNGQTVFISTQFHSFGRFRKRASIEMFFFVEDASKYPFLYFERFESGATYPRKPAIR